MTVRTAWVPGTARITRPALRRSGHALRSWGSARARAHVASGARTGRGRRRTLHPGPRTTRTTRTHRSAGVPRASRPAGAHTRSHARTSLTCGSAVADGSALGAWPSLTRDARRTRDALSESGARAALSTGCPWGTGAPWDAVGT